MSETDHLLVERLDSCWVVTLNRPEVMNALTPAMVDDLTGELRAAATHRRCSAVVLTGVGRGFCVGIDVKDVAARDQSGDAGLDPLLASFESLHHGLSAVIRTIHSLPVPVIAAINGHAIGLGMSIAAACDLRVSGPDATFADGFIRRGISGCELGLSYFLPRIVGPAMAHELMLTGRRIDADEALRIGLVSQVVGDPAASALTLASEIAANAPAAVSMTKEVMWANLHAGSLDHAMALESRTQTLLRNTADAREARSAFLEKREPEFGHGNVDRRIQ